MIYQKIRIRSEKIKTIIRHDKHDRHDKDAEAVRILDSIWQHQSAEGKVEKRWAAFSIREVTAEHMKTIKFIKKKCQTLNHGSRTEEGLGSPYYWGNR